MSQTRTLYCCIGINKFCNFADAELNGCVNDAMDMAAFVDRVYPNATGQLCTDSNATRSIIMGTLLSLRTMANNDRSVGRIVITVSSHGTHVFDMDEDEVGEYQDEAIVCHDTALKFGAIDPATCIVDDDLYTYLHGVPSRVLVEVWADTCFSGTLLKFSQSQLKGKPRYLLNPAASGRPKRIRKFRVRKQQANAILWSGCADDQTSADALIDKRYNGAMTYAFLHHFDAKKCRTSILRSMRSWLKKEDYTQTPQLECETKYKIKTLI